MACLLEDGLIGRSYQVCESRGKIMMIQIFYLTLYILKKYWVVPNIYVRYVMNEEMQNGITHL
jgi:hypothetical protein